MNEYIGFDPLYPAKWIFASLFVLAVFILWLESKKPLRLIWLRIVSAVLMILSVMIILMRPSIRVPQNDIIVFLTKDYSQEKADSILKTHSGSSIYYENDTESFPGAIKLSSYNQIGDLNGRISYVIGQGVPKYALDLLDSPSFEFLPSQKRPGIQYLSWPKTITVNQETEIHFLIRDSPDTKIELSGPGGKEDSLFLEERKNSFYKLRLTPKEPGNFLYEISVSDGDGKIYTEKLPLTVQPERQLNILFLLAYPSFESQYLKRYLSKKHKLAVRYKVSKNIYRHEAVNRPPLKFRTLNSDLLRRSDLLIIDSDELQSLGDRELIELKESISAGLGMLILLNDGPVAKRSLKVFLPQLEKTKVDTSHIFTGSKKIILPVLPLQIQGTKEVFPLIRSGNKIISSYQYYGFGKAGFSLLQETYRRYLEGDTISYSRIWSDLIRKTSGAQRLLHDLRIKSDFPFYADEPVHFDVTGPEPEIFYNNRAIPLAEDLYVDDLWHGKFWPDKSGWNDLLIANDSSTFSFYVSENHEWSSLRAASIAAANQRNSSKTKTKHVMQLKPISPLPFYLIFILFTGLLWVTPRL